MAGISCPTVVQDVSPCLPFLSDSSIAKPSDPCCRGVQEVNGMVRTKEDRVEVCECLKTALKNVKYDPKRIPIIGKDCGGINLPPIDQNTNCSK